MSYKRTIAPLTEENYQQQYNKSLADNDSFWLHETDQLDWIRKPTTGFRGNMTAGDIRWFEDGILNVAYNCIDRHLPEHAEDIAFIWEDNLPDCDSTITYQALHDSVAKLANAFKKQGIKKGDVVCIYMPMIPQAAITMLACARIGAIHSVIFGGFSPDAIADRINDANCRYVVTADGAMRGNKFVPLKENIDQALEHCPQVNKVYINHYTGHEITMVEGRDHWQEELVAQEKPSCPCEPMAAEDPFFILYTSGSTGKPKGVLHTTGGYLLYATYTFKTAFDYQPGQVYWCTADIGWITGHSYIVYGPLANRATSLIYSGLPNYPTPSRCWEIVDKHQVNIFYTAPTAIRALMRVGESFVTSTSRKSLKILGTVGEPINPEVWQWYYKVVGESRCPIVDTWWQTETGGFMIFPIPGAIPLIPGSATKPFFGIDIALLDDQGQEIQGEGHGALAVKQPWPGMIRSVYGNHQRFLDTYLNPFPHYYLAGDEATRDSDGNYTITGRIDDVVNVAGHRIGTAELESIFVQHHDVAESAIVGCQHDIKGEALIAFVILKTNVVADEKLTIKLKELIKHRIGSFAMPDHIQFVPDLPKTRSGKIMRRVLRQIAHGDITNLGDTSTLANPEVVDKIISLVKSNC